MNRDHTAATSSSYYRFAFCDGLEALEVNNHKTPFPAHFHPTFNITLIYEGVFPTKLHDRLIIAPSGSILITNPQEIHANPFQKVGKLRFLHFMSGRIFLITAIMVSRFILNRRQLMISDYLVSCISCPFNWRPIKILKSLKLILKLRSVV